MLWKLWLRRYWNEALFFLSLSLTMWSGYMMSQHNHGGCCDYEAGTILGGIITFCALWFNLPDIIGRYRYAYLEADGKGKCTVAIQSFLDEDRVVRALFVVRIPHGGWFRTSCRYETQRPTKRYLMPVLGNAGFWSFKAALRFRDGVLLLEKEQAVRLLFAYPELSQREQDLPSSGDFVRILLELNEMHGHLVSEVGEKSRQITTLLDALTETTRTLSDTKRVGKSKEARRIKDEVLLPALNRSLANDDPRRGEFGLTVKEAASSVPAPVLATVS